MAGAIICLLFVFFSHFPYFCSISYILTKKYVKIVNDSVNAFICKDIGLLMNCLSLLFVEDIAQSFQNSAIFSKKATKYASLANLI